MSLQIAVTVCTYTWLSKNVCKPNLNLVEKLKLFKESKAKRLRSLASQFDVSVGAVNNILKRKCEYENLRDPLG